MTNGSRLLAIAMIGLGLFAPISTAIPAPKAQLSMVTGKLTSQPIGHYEFCRAHREECSLRVRNSQAARVTARGWQVVRDINQSTNAQIHPMTDQDAFGREEYWSYPVDAGDCEDFVLLKRARLLQAGFSASDLLITVVRKPDGEGHAVLTIRTTEGDFVLDNLHDDIKPWYLTPYTYLKRQASFDTGRWVSIENGTTDLMVGALK